MRKQKRVLLTLKRIKILVGNKNKNSSFLVKWKGYTQLSKKKKCRKLKFSR